MQATETTTVLPRDLGDGLVLRRGRPADAEAVAYFNSMVQRDPGEPGPSAAEEAWALDMFDGRHPGLGPADFLLVEDTRSGRPVSLTNLMAMVWQIGGVRFNVGRPESVGTLPEYRHRGLVRTQFAVLHAWSAARGDMVQGITGIPYYYRQFGYEMAMDLAGGRLGGPLDVTLAHSGALAPEAAPEAEPFRICPAAPADLPFIMQTDGTASARWLVACILDEAHWRYELFGKRAKSVSRLEWCILETPDGEPAGYFGHSPVLQPEGRLAMPVCELRPGLSWLAPAPSILRYLFAEGRRYAERDGKPFAGVYAELGANHPFLEATHGRLSQVIPPWTWYLRVPEPIQFLQHLAPVLEARLAHSIAAGHTGALKLSLYRQGIGLSFEAGRLARITAWQPEHDDPGDVVCPPLTFLQLLFGWRDLDELCAQYPDCGVYNDRGRVLMRALFPKGPSHMWPAT